MIRHELVIIVIAWHGRGVVAYQKNRVGLFNPGQFQKGCHITGSVFCRAVHMLGRRPSPPLGFVDNAVFVPHTQPGIFRVRGPGLADICHA